jgi:hypothetical protein
MIRIRHLLGCEREPHIGQVYLIWCLIICLICFMKSHTTLTALVPVIANSLFINPCIKANNQTWDKMLQALWIYIWFTINIIRFMPLFWIETAACYLCWISRLDNLDLLGDYTHYYWKQFIQNLIPCRIKIWWNNLMLSFLELKLLFFS